MANDNDQSSNAYGDAYDDFKRKAKHLEVPLWVLDLYGSPYDYLLYEEVDTYNHGLNVAEIGWVWCEFFGYDPHNDASQPGADDGAPHSS